jgi:hypothetical protein
MLFGARTHYHVCCKNIQNLLILLAIFTKNNNEAGAYELGFRCAFRGRTFYYTAGKDIVALHGCV